ncbi:MULTISPECIES: amino acid adenylation domain-containing protein [Acidiphilium]|uniref:amino acid adenylation domain-containing protein n=1 Tax=Acidiphilium TaxID=522 RepID=UPI0021CB8E9E|nr:MULTISPECIES: amino acid adenylation domain-containing protein [Acidiphilium]
MHHEERSLPLTVAQRGLWIGEKIAPRGSIFNIAESIEIPGAIDPDLFLAALRAVAAETDTIRVRIAETGNGPRQIIEPAYTKDFPVFDVSGATDPRAEAEAWMWRELSAPVDLACDRLWMGALFRAGPDRWFWYHRAHHIMFDGFTGGLVARRVAELYTASVERRAAAPCPFGSLGDLIAHDQAYRGSPRFERDRAFWLEHLADLPPAMSLAMRRVPGGGGLRRRTAHLSPDVSRRLHAMAKPLGASLPQVLIALVAAYYHRATGASDLVIGMPVTGRPSAVLRSIPGMVANAVPLRLRFTPDMSFAALVSEVGRAVLRALRHQQFRYEELRRDLGLFGADQQVSWLGVNIEPFDYVLNFGGHAAITHNLSNGSVEDLMIFIYDRADARGLRIDFDANPVLYDDADLALHEARLIRLMTQAIADPASRIAGYDLFANGERSRILVDWNATARPLPARSVAARIGDRAEATPDAPSIITGGEVLTYRDLLARADAIASRLRAAGIGPGHLVAIALPRDADLPCALLGVMRAGAAYLPLDPDQPAQRLAMILDDAKPCLLLTDVELAAKSGVANIATLRLDAPDPTIRPRAVKLMPSVPEATAYVIFTSGSTGRPKGVVVSRTALDNLCAGFEMLLGLGPRDRMLAVTTIGFDIAALEFLLPLLSGAAIVLAGRALVRDPALLAATIRDQGVTVMQATPSLYQAMLNASPDEASGSGALAGLTLLVGGETLPPHLAVSLHAAARRLINVYGPTETTIWSTAHEMREEDCGTPPIGRPIANTRVYVLDDAGEPVPPGVAGNLHIGGAGIALGYLGQPDLTAERFISDPFAPEGARMFRTGDIARFREDGILECLGRSDDQIKIRGFRVELGEVEAALVAIPGVAAAAAALREAAGRKQLIGYVVPRDTAWPEPAALRRALADRLPDYMIPAAFVVLSDLPLNANNKLDRAALPAPETTSRATASTDYVAPRTKGEIMLAELWAETFGLECVSIHDNFFALGGDSLMAARMVADLAGRFSADLPIGALFQDATIANLAPYLDGAENADPLATLLTLRAGNGSPALFCVHPVAGLSWGYAGLARHLAADHAIYGLQSIGLADAMPSSIEAMAAHYLDEMRTVQPRGPYMLVGWSLGGLIAHAIAERLCHDGETVRLLALLDSYPFRLIENEHAIEEAELVAASLGFLGYAPDRLAGTPRMDALAELLANDYSLADIPLPPSLRTGDIIGRVRSVTERNLSLARRFTPGHAPLDVLFLRAAHRPVGSADRFLDDRPEAWSRHIGGRLIVHDIPCRHQDMLDPEPLGRVGRIIAQAIA